MRNWAEIEYPSEGNGAQRAVWWTFKLGASVFPCGVVRKKASWVKQPFITGWQKPDNCASTAEAAIKMWDLEYPAECGVLLDKFVLVDLDTKEGFYDGKEGFKKIVADLGLSVWDAISGALVYETPGRSGGVHILWRKPSGVGGGLSKTVPCAGVEVLGRSHYFLAPCSPRPDRAGLEEYRLVAYPPGLVLSEPPVELWGALRSNAGVGVGVSLGGSSKPSLEVALAWSDDGVVLPGLRHDVLFKESCRRAVFGGGGTEWEVVEWLREILEAEVMIGVEDFPDSELERMARNACRWAASESESESESAECFDVEAIKKAAAFYRSITAAAVGR